MSENTADLRRKLSTPEAAAYLGLGKSTLDKLRLTGGGPRFITLGRRVVYDLVDLEAWTETRKRTNTSETLHQERNSSGGSPAHCLVSDA
jgi:predicted DNA-binding transcriptional regulator AlpA